MGSAKLHFIMGYAIYHTAKGKGSGHGLGGHIDREKGKEYSYKTADPNLSKLNIDRTPSKYKNLSLSEAISKRVGEGYNGKRKIRTDAVKYLTHILTASHKEMIDIFNSEEKKKAWIKANIDFIKEEFGGKNVVRFTIHMDEKTPHIHCVTVPLTEDGRLSAKELLGNKKEMELRQDRYFEMMKEFNLERGLKNTGRKHETAKEYKKRMSNLPSNDELKPIKGLFGVNKAKTMDLFQKELKEAKNTINDYVLKLESEEKESQRNLESKNYLKGELKKIEENYHKDIIRFKKIIHSPEETKRVREIIRKEIEELEKKKTLQQSKNNTIKNRVKNTGKDKGNSIGL